uniref:Copia protein n=1 Tax=Tanacetum cinerariifolium TaxID=118510 RepID=A0A6L2MAU5_TANCI|nr:copia protein [Tanacetum cinerariifolium]
MKVMEKDLKSIEEKRKKVKSIALKAKKESCDDETSTFGSDDEEYAMAVRNFKKFFRRKGKFFRQPREEKKSFRQRDEKKGKRDRKCFRCVKESLNVTFDESPPPIKLSPLDDDDVGEEQAIKNNTKVVNNNNEEDELIEVDEVVNIKKSIKHPLDQKTNGRRNIFNQSRYIKEMLKSSGWKIPNQQDAILTEIKLTKEDEAHSMDSSKYRGMIGSLLYLTASRPDSMFSVCLCAHFQENPKTTHLEAVKRIFRYIRGTTHLGLWYPKRTGIETIVYADSDHAGYYVDRKSTSGVCTFIECCLTSWFDKKQTALAISTTEAEYLSAGKACQQALSMKQALIDYDIRIDGVSIMCNNKCTIDLSKNPVQHSKTKHIEIHHHFLRDNVQKGNISIEKVASEDNIADIFTKPLKREVFNYLIL